VHFADVNGQVWKQATRRPASCVIEPSCQPQSLLMSVTSFTNSSSVSW